MLAGRLAAAPVRALSVRRATAGGPTSLFGLLEKLRGRKEPAKAAQEKEAEPLARLASLPRAERPTAFQTELASERVSQRLSFLLRLIQSAGNSRTAAEVLIPW